MSIESVARTAQPRAGDERRGSRLRLQVDLALHLSSRTVVRMFDHRKFERHLPDYLVLLHQVVRASTPLMWCARNVAAADPTASWSSALVGYLDHHIVEETDHDKWLEHDLATVNITRDDLRSRLPLPELAQTVGAVYYYAKHISPLAILGYISAVETRPISLSRICQWRNSKQYPDELFRTLEFHAVEDEAHQEDLYRFIDDLPADPRESELVRSVALGTIQGFDRMFACYTSMLDAV